MKAKWYGTAAIAFTAKGKTLLFDPYFTVNPDLPKPNLLELASCGEIFITHGHFDHLVDVPRVIEAGGGPVFCSEIAAKSLLREGVKQKDICVIKPGDKIVRGPFKIIAFRGKHIRFDPKLILQTLFNRRVALYRQNLMPLVQASLRYPKGEVLVFLIEAEGKRVLHLGSLSMDEQERYPERVDILTLPYQGRSDLLTYSPRYISRLQPKSIYLHHFDDSFPPISSPIDVEPFIAEMARDFPGTKVIQPKLFETVSL